MKKLLFSTLLFYFVTILDGSVSYAVFKYDPTFFISNELNKSFIKLSLNYPFYHLFIIFTFSMVVIFLTFFLLAKIKYPTEKVTKLKDIYLLILSFIIDIFSLMHIVGWLSWLL